MMTLRHYLILLAALMTPAGIYLTATGTYGRGLGVLAFIVAPSLLWLNQARLPRFHVTIERQPKLAET